eukprot:7047087-Prymnesium_polylepis.1
MGRPGGAGEPHDARDGAVSVDVPCSESAGNVSAHGVLSSSGGGSLSAGAAGPVGGCGAGGVQTAPSNGQLVAAAAVGQVGGLANGSAAASECGANAEGGTSVAESPRVAGSESQAVAGAAAVGQVGGLANGGAAASECGANAEGGTSVAESPRVAGSESQAVAGSPGASCRFRTMQEKMCKAGHVASGAEMIQSVETLLKELATTDGKVAFVAAKDLHAELCRRECHVQYKDAASMLKRLRRAATQVCCTGCPSSRLRSAPLVDAVGFADILEADVGDDVLMDMGDVVRTLDAGNWLELTTASESAVQIFVIDTMGTTQTVDVVLSHTVASATEVILEKLGMVDGTDL